MMEIFLEKRVLFQGVFRLLYEQPLRYFLHALDGFRLRSEPACISVDV